MNIQTASLLSILRGYIKVCIPTIAILLSLISPSLALAYNAPNLGTQPYLRYWAPTGTHSLRIVDLAPSGSGIQFKRNDCKNDNVSQGGYHDLSWQGNVGDLIAFYAFSDNKCTSFLGWAGGTIPSQLINTAECWFDIPRSNVSGCNGTTDPMVNDPAASNGSNSLGTQPYIRYWAPTGTHSLRIVILPPGSTQPERNDCKNDNVSQGGYHDLSWQGNVGKLIILHAYSDNNCTNFLGWAGGTIPSQLINTAECWFDIPRSNVSGCNGTTDPMN